MPPDRGITGAGLFLLSTSFLSFGPVRNIRYDKSAFGASFSEGEQEGEGARGNVSLSVTVESNARTIN